MHREASEAATVVAAQWDANAASLAALGARLRAHPPRVVVTLARGSSDHAATYAKYLVETRTRLPTASAAPSVSSLYGVDPELRDCLVIAISQSGRSPDLLAAVAAAKRGGALVVALCNEVDTPLAQLADCSVPLCAGPELSVAATKSFIASLAALAHLVAAWTADRTLLEQVHAMPQALDEAWRLDWGAALPVLAPAQHLYAIGRGLGLAIAQEAALKCKETCGLHAEAHSGAEVRHGPFALPGRDFPALVLAQDDAALPGLTALAAELAGRGVPTLIAGAHAAGAIELPTLRVPGVLAPIALAPSLYRLLVQLAIARGHDPDRPPHLRKVTETL
ncbi:MAG: SIS domain-containing protein [Proteobacteria bacterium]|nr:SIS domain-containing protein [Pseudomonadota bacterium]